MPKRYTMKPGLEFEVPIVEDIVRPINERILEIMGKNARFNRDIVTGNADAAGNFSINSGPSDGFLWAVMLVATSVGNTTANWGLYVNSITALSAISPTQTGSGVLTFGKAQIILKANDKLILSSGAALAPANAIVGFAVHAIEVPIQHEAQLLL